METIAFIRLHQFVEAQQEIMDQIAQYCDGLFVLTHNLLDKNMHDVAARHPKCIEIRQWEGGFGNLAQLQYCLKWASEIKPKYVFEFDEDEIPPYRFNEVFDEFKLSSKKTMWLKGVWSWNGIYQIALNPMRKYFAHMKVYKWSEEIAKMDRGGFNTFKGMAFCSPDTYLSNYPLIHAAFSSPALIANRMIVGDSKRHIYDDSSWFNQNVKAIPYDKDLSNGEWMQLYYETINNNIK